MVPSNKPLILGAGLAGAIMYGVLGQRATVVERLSPRTTNHQAIMHFRTPELGQLLDLELTPVTVYKTIYYEDQYFDTCNLFFSNLYSLKTLDVLAPRSITDIGVKERWINTTGIPFNHTIRGDNGHKFGCMITKIEKGRVCYSKPSGESETEESNTIISTLPMPLLLQLLGEDLSINLDSAPIWVYRLTLPEGYSTVCQTIYYPDPKFPVYRASIDFDQVIIESLKQLGREYVDDVLMHFGIRGKGYTVEEHQQKLGKIKPLPDDTRRSILYGITNKYGIYSIGRFALWKNVHSHDILNDARKIKRFLSTPEQSRKYLIKKEVDG